VERFVDLNKTLKWGHLGRFLRAK